MKLFWVDRILPKVILFVVGLVSVSLAVYVGVFVRTEVQQGTEQILQEGITFAELSSSVLYQDYLTSSARGFPRFQDIALERLQRNPNILQVTLIATNGKVIFDSGDFAMGVTGRTEGSGDRFITDPQTKGLLQKAETSHRSYTENGLRFTEIMVPITEAGGGHVFSMRYVLSYRSLEARKGEIFKVALITSFPLFVVTIVGGILLAISFTRPIELLSKAAEQIRSGNLDIQVPVNSRDEMGQLAVAFNHMAGSLKQAQQQLTEYSRELEQQVEGRTKELQTKIAELEQMNNILVGREIKMSELKKENEELKARVGK